MCNLNFADNSEHEAAAHQIDVCHAPPGNTENWQQLRIDINGLHGHENHQYDFVGKCRGEHDNKEITYVVSDCQDDPDVAVNNYRTQLLTAIINYYSPVVITHPVIIDAPDTAAETADFSIINQLWDETTEKILSFFSDCRDSAKGDAKILELDGRDYWFVIGCKDLAADYAYKTALRQEADSHFSFTYHVIPDAALDTDSVKSSYDDCLNGHPEREILHHHVGDGFNFRVLTGCPNSAAIDNALDSYWAAVQANTDLPIVLSKSSLDDYRVMQAYTACCDAGQGGGNCIYPPSDKGFAGRLNWREVTPR